jgi:hypothetical protein
MRSTQTRFPQPKSRQWTWLHPNGQSKAQLDHILINGKWINSVRNVRAYNTVELNSDHRIVSAKISISLRVSKDNKCQRITYDWKKLKNSCSLQSQFNIEVQNRYDILSANNSVNNIQTQYDNFIESIQQTTENLVGQTKRTSKKNWVSDETIKLLNQRNEAKNIFKQKRNPNNKNNWHQLNKHLNSSYQNDKIKFLEDKLEQLNQAALSNQSRTTWTIIDQISGKRRYNSSTKIKDANGTKINSTTELMNEWKRYFEDLLNVKTNSFQTAHTIPPADNDLPINTGPITIEELQQAVKQLKNGKSPGLDHVITPELLKYGGDWIVNKLCHICNEIFEEQATPKQFNTNIIIPIPKKGDKTLMTNYRGISLMSVAAKTYNRILLNRIREPLDSILRINQAGFRKGRSCTDQIHILRRLLEGAIDKQLPIYTTFIDFKKALDSIERKTMFDILRHYGVPMKMVKAIQAIYNNSRSAVLVDGYITQEFDITTGVLQGDTLAPFLFIIVIDYVMKNAETEHTNEQGEHGFVAHRRQSKRHPATTIHDLAFADDIALFESDFDRAQTQLNTTTKWANKVGLQVNIKKTQALTNQNINNKSMQINGEDIQWVDNFKYLGSMVLSSNTDIKVRKGLAWKAFWKLRNIWKSTTVPTKLKINIFKASCISILLYDSESWILTKTLEKSLNSFATSCYRIILNIKRLDKISNNRIYETVKQEPLVQTIQRRQLRFIGHCLRRNQTEFTNTYALYTPKPGHGKRKCGRPRLQYVDYAARLINNDDPPTTDEIRRTAADRKCWYEIVIACKPRLFAAD